MFYCVDISEQAIIESFFEAARTARIKRSLWFERRDIWKHQLSFLCDQQQARLITQDIFKGLRIHFEGDDDLLPQRVSNIAKTHEERKAMSRDFIFEFLQGNCQRFFGKPKGICRLLVVPKDGDKFRLCRDFSVELPGFLAINSGIPKEKTRTVFPKLTDLVKRAIRVGRNGFGFCVDGRGYYRQFFIHPEDQKYLVYKWLTILIQDGYLPFGISSATQGVQRTSNALCELTETLHLTTFKELWDLLLAYIDDFCGFAPNELQAFYLMNAFFTLCNDLGVLIAGNKIRGPARNVRMLGFIFDFPSQTLSIPDDKIGKVKDMIAEILERRYTWRKELQSLLGKLQWMAQVLFPSRIMLRHLYNDLKGCPAGKHKRFYLSDPARQALHWWTSMVDVINAAPFETIVGVAPANILRIETDASGRAMGFWARPFWAQLHFSELPSEWSWVAHAHITIKELFAVAWAISTLGDRIRHSYIKIYIDNEPAEKALEKLSSPIPAMARIIRVIAMMTLKFRMRFFTRRITTDDNVVADALSRDKWHTFRNETRFWNTQQIVSNFQSLNEFVHL